MALLLEKQSIPDLGHFEVEVKVSADIKVTAQTARKKVQRFLMDEISLQIWADGPTLVLSDRLVWRVPAYLSLPGWGNLGQVGSVDVDAETGEFSITSELRARIEQRALNLSGKYPADRATIHETPVNYQAVGHESE
jgi:hypothetical protein